MRGSLAWPLASAILVVALGLPGCGRLPALWPLASVDGAAASVKACRAAFPKGAFSTVHSLDVTLPALNQRTIVIGVAEGEARSGKLKCVLLSPEGLVLFEAEALGGRLTVHRAVPPLDDPEFAARLVADVRLLLFAPPGEPSLVGQLSDGRCACRFSDGESTRDVVLEPDGGHSIVDYGTGTTPVREARACPPVRRGLAKHARLRVRGLFGYDLRFELLEASHGP